MRVWLMRVLVTALWLTGLLSGARIAFAAEGVFEGQVVEPPDSQPASPGWIFVEGRNHLLRRVEVTHAVVFFGQQVPASQRRKCRWECLEAGQEVKVTAGQDQRGEWRARRVEIIKLTTKRVSGPIQQANVGFPHVKGYSSRTVLGETSR